MGMNLEWVIITHVSAIQVKDRKLNVVYGGRSAAATPLNALAAEDDDDMIILVIVLVIMFLLAAVALLLRMCMCLVPLTCCWWLGALPSYPGDEAEMVVVEEVIRPKSGTFNGKEVEVVSNASADNESYTSEVVTEYDEAGGIVRQEHRRTRRNEHNPEGAWDKAPRTSYVVPQPRRSTHFTTPQPAYAPQGEGGGVSVRVVGRRTHFLFPPTEISPTHITQRVNVQAQQRVFPTYRGSEPLLVPPPTWYQAGPATPTWQVPSVAPASSSSTTATAVVSQPVLVNNRNRHSQGHIFLEPVTDTGARSSVTLPPSSAPSRMSARHQLEADGYAVGNDYGPSPVFSATGSGPRSSSNTEYGRRSQTVPALHRQSPVVPPSQPAQPAQSNRFVRSGVPPPLPPPRRPEESDHYCH